MSVTGPGGGVSDAHRDHLAELLREHFAVGQIEVEEFSRRVEALLNATTPDQAATAVEDLPALSQRVPTARRPWWRRRSGGRHGQIPAARAGWLPTSERFRDPASGDLIRVWVDPADTSRHYVPEAPD